MTSGTYNELKFKITNSLNRFSNYKILGNKVYFKQSNSNVQGPIWKLAVPPQFRKNVFKE